MADRARPPRRASPCPPSGSRTRPPGSPGRTTSATGRASSRPSPGSTREIVRQLARGRDGAHPGGRRRRTRRRCAALLAPRRRADSGASSFRRFPTDRVWMRDAGPIWLVRGGERPARAIAGFRFNAWAKYADWQQGRPRPGARRPGALGCRSLPVVHARPRGRAGGRRHRRQRPRHAPHHRGVPARPGGAGAQPGLRPRSDYERSSATCSAPATPSGSGSGIAGDDTHGHVDDLARFVDAAHRRPVPRAGRRRPEPRAAARRTASGSRAARLRGRRRAPRWSSCPCRRR